MTLKERGVHVWEGLESLLNKCMEQKKTYKVLNRRS